MQHDSNVTLLAEIKGKLHVAQCFNSDVIKVTRCETSSWLLGKPFLTSLSGVDLTYDTSYVWIIDRLLLQLFTMNNSTTVWLNNCKNRRCSYTTLPLPIPIPGFWVFADIEYWPIPGPVFVYTAVFAAFPLNIDRIFHQCNTSSVISVHQI